MSDRDTPAEVIEDAAAGITARSCSYGSCDRMRGHDGPHWCRCSKPVEAPANGCKWHTGPPVASDRDTLNGHQPREDDGVTYCGWHAGDGVVVDGCGEVWPCATVREVTSE